MVSALHTMIIGSVSSFGLGRICVCLPMGSSVAFMYIMDCYKEVAGEGIVTAIFFRNTMGEFLLSQTKRRWFSSLTSSRDCICICCRTYDQWHRLTRRHLYPVSISRRLLLGTEFAYDHVWKDCQEAHCESILEHGRTAWFDPYIDLSDESPAGGHKSACLGTVEPQSFCRDVVTASLSAVGVVILLTIFLSLLKIYRALFNLSVRPVEAAWKP